MNYVTIIGIEEIVYKYKKGDYFGELALLKNQPRAASIIAAVILPLIYANFID